jgi:DNA-binding NarL/FixJ family response regulator
MEHRAEARLVIADDHQLLAEACRLILEPKYKVVSIVADGRELLKAAATLKPDLIILDIRMPHLNGLDAGLELKRKMPSIKLIYLTMMLNPEIVAEAFRRGASGYVLKQSTWEELSTAMQRVIRGESYLSPLITRETVNFFLNQPLHQKKITRRQNEVLQFLAEGKSMKEVASALNIKPGTVAFLKYRMMETLGVKTNAELLRYAMTHPASCLRPSEFSAIAN